MGKYYLQGLGFSHPWGLLGKGVEEGDYYRKISFRRFVPRSQIVTPQLEALKLNAKMQKKRPPKIEVPPPGPGPFFFRTGNTQIAKICFLHETNSECPKPVKFGAPTKFPEFSSKILTGPTFDPPPLPLQFLGRGVCAGGSTCFGKMHAYLQHLTKWTPPVPICTRVPINTWGCPISLGNPRFFSVSGVWPFVSLPSPE